MGQFPYQLIGSTFRLDTVGFDAIGVALLGHMTATGILFGALLFGGLRQGAGLMQLQAGVPGDLVFIIQALVLFSIASEFLPAIRRKLPRWNLFNRKSALATRDAGLTVSAIPQDSSGENGSEPIRGELQSRDPGQTDAPGIITGDAPEER